MTFDSLKLDYTQRGYVLWIECVMEQARLLNKNGIQIKQKLIDGLPAFFNTEKSAMRHNNTYVYPALLGGVPEYAMTSLAANVHPMAGQQDGESLLMSYFADFISKASETKQIPLGGLPSTPPGSVLSPDCELLQGWVIPDGNLLSEVLS